MGAGYGYPPAGGDRGKMRVGDAERDRMAEFLQTAYVDGRLSRDEYDARLESTLSARTFGELDQLATDLPAIPARVVRPAVVTPVAETNGFAVASLVCGLIPFIPATISAIVFGHIARRQIKRTGQRGAGMALAGLTLGWVWVTLAIVAVLAFVRPL